MAPERHALTLFLFTSAVDGPRGRVRCRSPSRGKPCNVPQAGPNLTAHRDGEGRACLRVNAQIFLFLHSPGTRASVHTYVDRQTGRAEAKLHVGHSCSSGSCFQTQIFIHRTCERSVQDGRIQAACTQASPASRRMACARRPRAPKHRGVKFSPGFPAH